MGGMLSADGPTPGGGVRSEAFLTDAAGAPTDDPAEAVAVEVVEYGPGDEEIGRTYARTDLPASDLPSELSDDDVDAPKATWDVTVSRDGIVKYVETLDELSAVLDREALGEPLFRSTVASMMTLPAWQSAPAGLRAEIVTYLEAGRPK